VLLKLQATINLIISQWLLDYRITIIRFVPQYQFILYRFHNNLMEDDSLNCNICFRLARDALECSHPKCHKLFCKGCYNYIKQQRN
jgi:hypothetical protein